MSSKNTNKTRQRRNRRSRQRYRNRNRRPKVVRAPAAFGGSAESYFRLFDNRDGSITVNFQEVFPVTFGSSAIAEMIPFTPTKWSHTRLRSLASTYTQFRPLQVSMKWLPSLPTTAQGNIAIGTMFNGARLDLGNFAGGAVQALAATNGGVMGTIWKPLVSRPYLGRNLPYNGYSLYQVSDDEIPFWIIVAADQGDELQGMGGFLAVRGSVTFRNPSASVNTPPIEYSDDVTFEDEAGQTIMKTGTINGLSVGESISFLCNKALELKTGGVIAIGTAIIATLKNIATGQLTFDVSNQIKAQTAKIFTIGRTAIL